MTRNDIAYFLKKRTPYKITTRPGAVVAWLTPWHGAIIRSGKRPTIHGTIPDPGNMMLYLVLVFLTFGLLGLFWHFVNPTSEDVAHEIRGVFARELGIKLP